ncbi:MAG: leucine--tRNA ligase [Candidatus Aenigmatarchaeota archaeon]|nr:MAG: leucine--tRNA ligase [Candidatus Aenigmarchaeota archaeon]
MEYDFRAVEKKWQEKWADARIFEPGAKGKKFLFTVPFPYTSGPLHVGHGRTFTIGDFIARYKRKMGFNVLYPMAFHMSGTPVLAISRAIEAGDKKTTDLYTDYVSLYDPKNAGSIIKSFKDPWNVANFFASVIEKDFRSIGYSIDWTRTFNSGEPIYNAFIEWQYLRMREKNVITKGSYPILYSPDMQNAVGEDDIKDGDTDPVDLQEYTVVKFRMGGDVLPAATLRPETVFGVTNIWVNPDASYERVRVADETWILSKEAAAKLRHQKENVGRIGDVKAKELIGKEVEILGRTVPILPATFVDADHATGVVYSVPAHAPYDYAGLVDCQKKGLGVGVKPIKIVDIEGYGDCPAEEACKKFGAGTQADEQALDEATNQLYKDEFYKGALGKKCGEFAGLKISEVKDTVKAWMRKKGNADVFYEPSRRAVTRDGRVVIGAVLRDQWFLDYTSKEWKEKTKKLVDGMDIYPEKYRKSLRDLIDWLEKRPCARRRGIGTKLPWDKEWTIESLSDSTLYMALYTVAPIIRKEARPEQLVPEVFDFIFLGKGAAKDVAKQSGVKERALKEMREQFEYWYAVDQRHTTPAHLSNHLSFYLLHHTLLFPEKYWPRAQTLNEMLLGVEGQKMSKSKGNVIPLLDVSRKYSADLFRTYVLSAADIDTTMDWWESIVASTKGKLYQFVELMDAVSKAKPAKKTEGADRWMTGRFYQRLARAKTAAETYKIRAYVIELFYDMLTDIAYYRRRVGDERAMPVIRTFAEDWLVALEPVMPHQAEEFWERFGNKPFVSLAKWPKGGATLDRRVELSEDVVKRVLEDVAEIRKIADIEKPRRVVLFVAPEWKRRVYALVRAGKQLKDVMQDAELKKFGQDIAKYVPTLQKRVHELQADVLTEDEEYEALKSAAEFLQKETGAAVEIVRASASKEQKARAADVHKPGILIG